jgi:hypothetical protein
VPVSLFHCADSRNTFETKQRPACQSISHASLRADDITADELERRFGVRLRDDLPRGGIVGAVELIDCVKPHASRWYAPGCWSFVLGSPDLFHSSSGRARCRFAMLLASY